MQLTNPVRETLRRGGVTLGVFITMASPEIVEISALAGFDFVLLDAEHGPISPESAYPMILAAESRGIPAMARIGQNDRQVILKFLDLGIAGVMIPRTETAEDARLAVEAMRYHPRGVRGLAGNRLFDYGLGAPPKELVPAVNDRVVSIIQFEHINALANLDALLATPDLDVLFIGPNDLAQSMGYPGEPTHPEVQSVIDRVCDAARGGDIALGTVATDATTARRHIERGFRMVVASAATLLGRASREFTSAAR